MTQSQTTVRITTEIEASATPSYPVQVKIAEEQGLLLVSEGYSTGYLLPKYDPCGSLEEAIQQVQLDILVETATGEKRVMYSLRQKSEVDREEG